MNPTWKRWLGAATVLLLVGAGCAPAARQERSTETSSETKGGMMDDGMKGSEADIDASATLDESVDVAADAALKEADADAMLEFEEGTDATLIENDNAELDAYGKAYDKSQL